MNDSQKDSIQLLQLPYLDLLIFIFATIKTYQVNNYHENSIQLF